jgi:hypothetical protein
MANAHLLAWSEQLATGQGNFYPAARIVFKIDKLLLLHQRANGRFPVAKLRLPSRPH